MKIAILGESSFGSELVSYLKEQQIQVRWFHGEEKKVLRVHKRFTEKADPLLKTHFRVVYEEEPREKIKGELAGENREILQKLSEVELKNLAENYEGFEDFDLVISLGSPMRSGPNGEFAIGEGGHPKFSYGDKKLNWEQGESELAYIGEIPPSKDFLHRLLPWLIEGEGERRLFYISTGENPEFPEEFLEKIQAFEAERIESFEKSLRHWQKLEDFEKVKISPPKEPIGCLVFFSAHEVTAVSQLMDSERIYLTCEVNPYGQPRRGRENSFQKLKTIGVDRVWVQRGVKLQKCFSSLRPPIQKLEDLGNPFYEPGFFFFPENPIKDFEKYLLYYFQRGAE